MIRPMIKYIKDNYPHKDLIGIEIGVAEGLNALSILQNLPIKKLYLIDPYKGKRAKYLEQAEDSLKNYTSKIEILRYRSGKIHSKFEDNSLDFVYIDGDHTRAGVTRDVDNYYSKVKVGGIFGGHDYTEKGSSKVRYVSERFAKKYNYELNIEECEDEGYTHHFPLNDWWVVKK